jgi:glycosyltransferase involved in cell wall biosynthesis
MSRFLAPPPVREAEPGRTPTFSVVIAAYQVADVIGEALDSLRRQTLPPLEVIVCDDGSTDGLEAALAPYHDELVFIRKENGGEASAKNAAAAHAHGDFIAILDGDDVYLPTRLASLAELAVARPDLDILTTDAFLVVNGASVRNNYDETWRFEVTDQRRAILQRNFVFGHAAVRRASFAEHGGFDESIRWTTDWDLWLRMILSGSAAGCVDEPLAIYRLRENSLTAQRRELLLGKLATLEKARGNTALRSHELPVLEGAIDRYSRDLSLFDLRAAVVGRMPDARRRALEVARAPAFSRRRRLEALVMAVAPGATSRILRRRAAKTWVGAGGTHVRRGGDSGALRT